MLPAVIPALDLVPVAVEPLMLDGGGSLAIEAVTS